MKCIIKYTVTWSIFLFSVTSGFGQIIDKDRYFGIGTAFKSFTITTPGLPVNVGRGINGSVNTGRSTITPFGREVNKVIKLYSQGQTERAIIISEVLLESAEIKGSTNRVEIAICLNLLARLHYQQKHSELAEMYFKQAVSVNEAAQGGDQLGLADSLERMGVFYYQRAFEDRKNEQAWMSKAAPSLTQALKIRQKELGTEHLDMAQLHVLLGNIYRYGEKRYDLAEPHYKQAFVIGEKSLQPDDLDMAIAAGRLAEVYRLMEKYDDAEPLFKKALKIREKKLGLEDPALEDALAGLTALYLRQDKLSEAEPYGIRALAIKTKQLGDGHIELAYHQFQLALIYHKQNQLQKAETLYGKALAIREKSQGHDHADLAPVLHNLAMIYQVFGRNDKAEEFRKRSETIKTARQ